MIDYGVLFFLFVFILWLYIAEKTYDDRIVYHGRKGVRCYYPNKFFSIFQFMIGFPIVLYMSYSAYIAQVPLGHVIAGLFFMVILYILFSVVFTGDDEDE